MPMKSPLHHGVTCAKNKPFLRSVQTITVHGSGCHMAVWINEPKVPYGSVSSLHLAAMAAMYRLHML